MSTLRLVHPAGETPIQAGTGALDAARDDLAAWVAGRGLFVLTSLTVRRLHGPRLDFLTGETSPARRVTWLEVPDGEDAKTVAVAEELWQRMLAAGGKRDGRLVAFGGGSVGDLGGFVAGCFLRGIELVNVATTLLAQVDAAIGGKTGVDLPGGKNTVGLFHHPARVVLDPLFLTTLPTAELRSGLVEVVKMAFLLDPPLLDLVEETLPRLLAVDPDALGPVVERAAAAKIAVVERDPTEQGDRKLLNFGHTLGHAIESALGYEGLRHGEAVGHGLLFALELSEERGLPKAQGDRLRRVLGALGLPPLPGHLTADRLVELMKRDKKARETGLSWVLAAEVGRGEVVEGIGFPEIETRLKRFLA